MTPGCCCDMPPEYLAPGCRLVVTVPGGPRSAFDRHIGHRRHFSACAAPPAARAERVRTGRRHAGRLPLLRSLPTGRDPPGQAPHRRRRAGRGQRLGHGCLRGRICGCSTAPSAYNLTSSPFGWQLLAEARRSPVDCRDHHPDAVADHPRGRRAPTSPPTTSDSAASCCRPPSTGTSTSPSTGPSPTTTSSSTRPSSGSADRGHRASDHPGGPPVAPDRTLDRAGQRGRHPGGHGARLIGHLHGRACSGASMPTCART